jgi:hypothetical protein
MYVSADSLNDHVLGKFDFRFAIGCRAQGSDPVASKLGIINNLNFETIRKFLSFVRNLIGGPFFGFSPPPVAIANDAKEKANTHIAVERFFIKPPR